MENSTSYPILKTDTNIYLMAYGLMADMGQGLILGMI